ncbi:MAG: ABC transporter ATP-binding protein/permease [Oscillospiraceae bacterium]|nr:ABC transporter ATP-binding protein/permease [Oscillospiraceae bacterium]
MTYYFKKNWKKIALACSMGLLCEGLYVVIQLVMMREFDAAINLDFRSFLFWTAVTLGIYGLYLALAALGGVLEARAVRAMNNQVRHDLYLSLMDKTHAAYHSQDTGEYISWLTTNVKQIERLAWAPFFSCVQQTGMIVWCILALVSLHWLMLAAGLVSVVVMLAVPKLFQKRMERLGAVCAEAEAEGVSKLKDLLSGFDVLRSFGHMDRFLDQGDAVSGQIEEPNCRRSSAQNALSCFTGFFSVSLQIFQQVVTVALAFQGKIILGAMASASNLTAGIVNGLRTIANHRMSLASAKPYFKNITVHAGEISARSGDSMDPVTEAITVEGLNFRYGEKPILQELSLQFKKGGKYALTGPSGCGKSTLLKLLLGWLPDYGGAIRFDGKDARDFTPEQLQQQMSYIEQNVFLFNSTIRDNIILGETFTDEQMEKALRDSALADDLTSMPDGLDTIVGEEGGNLSGGQKQRVAIARALIHDRSILLVDEGTSALDQKNADIVEKSLLSNPDLTLILVSHHLTPERKEQFTQVFDLHPAA